MSNKNNIQTNYWLKNFQYIKRNNSFDNKLGKKVWYDLLKNKKIDSILECGSNIGRNLKQINLAYPKKKLSFIELNKKAFKICSLNKNIENSYNSSIQDCKILKNTYDLVFTSGVLIHLNDKTLNKVIPKIIDWSKNFIGVFFNNKNRKNLQRKKKLTFFKGVW